MLRSESNTWVQLYEGVLCSVHIHFLWKQNKTNDSTDLYGPFIEQWVIWPFQMRKVCVCMCVCPCGVVWCGVLCVCSVCGTCTWVCRSAQLCIFPQRAHRDLGCLLLSLLLPWDSFSVNYNHFFRQQDLRVCLPPLFSAGVTSMHKAIFSASQEHFLRYSTYWD